MQSNQCGHSENSSVNISDDRLGESCSGELLVKTSNWHLKVTQSYQKRSIFPGADPYWFFCSTEIFRIFQNDSGTQKRGLD